MTPLPLIGEEPELTKESPGDARLWSVTTLIGALDKPALVPWAALKTAEAAVDSDTWRYLLENEGRDAAVNWLKGARFRGPKGQRTATELGTAVHKAIERKLLDPAGRFAEQDRTDLELRPYLHAANQWLKDFAPKIEAAELTVFSEEFHYAGTLDMIAETGGLRFLIDTKTTREPYDARGNLKTPYPEVALQLAAYRHAQFAAAWRARQADIFKRRYYLLNESERALARPVPEVDHGAVLHLTPEGYGFYPVRCDEEIFDIFLAVVDAARFQFELAKDVVGNPMIPPSALQDSTDPFAGLPS